MSEIKRKVYEHQNHRQRVRNAFREKGAQQMTDRNLLELLLFYAIPRKDTNHLAGVLLEKFGSLEGVLNADSKALAEVEGMGESSTLLLTTLPEIFSRYSGKKSNIIGFFESEDLLKYVSDLFENSNQEEFYILCFDVAEALIFSKKISTGNKKSVTVDKRSILQTAFDCDADLVVLAHNHPFGDAAPSPEDITITEEAADLLAQTGCKLKDHIIVGMDSVLSLASTAKFKYLF